jgi:hypothetical protein
MVLKLTKKAMDKIQAITFDVEPKIENQLPLSEWYVNHFKLGRKGYFIITESKSLYSILEPSVGISSINIFKNRIVEIFKKFEKENNLKDNSIKTDVIYICKTSNRSVLGSQTDLIKMAESIYFYDYESTTGLNKINETPMSYTNSYPDKDILNEIKKRKDF